MRPIDADEMLLRDEAGYTMAMLGVDDDVKIVSNEKTILKAMHNTIQAFIQEMPTIETEPVKHGKWLDVCCEIKCSCCGEVYNDEIFLMRGEINYCPNCGAKMDPEVVPRR